MHGFIYVSQIIFFILNLTKVTLFSSQKIKRFTSTSLVCVLSTLLITSCGTQPKIKNTTSASKSITKDVPIVATAEEKIALAQSLSVQSVNDHNMRPAHYQQINDLLIEACQLFLQQQNFAKALWLANKMSTSPLNSENSENNTKNHLTLYKLFLVKAQSLLALNYPQEAQKQLQLANELVSHSQNNKQNHQLSLTFDYYNTSQKIFAAQGKPVLAVNAQLNAFALNAEATSEDVQAIWQQLETLTQWQITDLTNNNPPFIQGWAKLLTFSHQFGANPQQFSNELTSWQKQYPAHPAVSILPTLQASIASEQSPNGTTDNIAILLPLTGNQQKAGLAAQQGILAAYNTNANRQLFFIDTNQIDGQKLSDRISELKVNQIVGPLLKANVETFLSLSTQQPTLQIPTLLLNLPSTHPLSNYQVALSMRPEDEAIQAASTLSQHNFKKPIVLSHNDRVSKRLAIAFRDQWQSSTNHHVDIVYFDQGQQMQTSLKDSLDVNASQTRIKQLNSRLKYNIEAEPRNRRDIDMIYLVGTSAQTRLIKPYIDVNISPFADVIPVYASSRSHSDFNDKNNTSSITDLQGLTFTQIPWLLNSNQQDKTLSKLSEQLWPKRTDSLSRIFAMGFDSYHLLDKLPLMKRSPFIRHYGQTGVLKLNNNNIITRSLLWGQYKDNKVMQVAMD